MIIRPSRMRRAGLIALMGQKRNSYKVFVRKLKKRKHREEQGLGGRILLRGS
jgi:hypothetical protein